MATTTWTRENRGMRTSYQLGVDDARDGLAQDPMQTSADYAAGYASALQRPVDIAWIDDNDGCGPRKLQNSIRCF